MALQVSVQQTTITTIDLTPTWGEVGNIVKAMVQRRQWAALEQLMPDLARALACAQALTVVSRTLTDAQQAEVARILAAEVGKQGY